MRQTVFLLLSAAVGAAVLFFSAWSAVLVMVAFVLFYVFRYRFDWMVCVMLALAPVMKMPGFGEHIEFVKSLLVGIVLLTWLLTKILSQNAGEWAFMRTHPFNSFVVFFAVIIFFAVFQSGNISLSIHSALPYLITLISLYFFVDMLSAAERMKKFLIVIMSVAYGIALIAILQHIIVQYGVLKFLARYLIPAIHRGELSWGESWHEGFTFYRSVGTFHHPNLLGNFLAFFIPLNVVFLFFSKEKILKTVLTAGLVLLLGGILCSGSRGALLNMVFAFVFLGIIYRKRIPWKIIMVVFLCVFLGSLLLLPQIKAYFRMGEGVSFRDIIWMNSFRMIGEHPLSGVGLGMFPYEYYSRFSFYSLEDLKTALIEIEATGLPDVLSSFNAHNLFLNYAVEMGIGGVCALLIFYVILGKTVYRAFQQRTLQDNFNYALLSGSAAAIGGNFIHGLFEATPIWGLLAIGIPFTFLVALTVVSARNIVKLESYHEFTPIL